MSRILRLLWASALLAVMGVASQAQNAVEANRAKMDAPVKDFTMPNIMSEENKEITLSEFKDKKPVVLVFMAYTCPATWSYEGRLGKLVEEFGKDVAFIGVRCNGSENNEAMRKYIESKNFTFPVVLDRKGQLSAYFDVKVTPTFILIDKAGKMRYWGNLDDNSEEKSVKNTYLKSAIQAVLNDKAVATKRTQVFG
jgi:peroxiredoxin